MRMMGMALRVVRTDGVLALYNGLSASLCRQVGAARGVPTLQGRAEGPGPAAGAWRACWRTRCAPCST